MGCIECPGAHRLFCSQDAMSLATFDKESPARRILEHLQRSGGATIKEMEALLGVTTTAVRQQINALLAEGYIRRQTVHSGVGRPHHVYAMTDKARSLFGCHCDDLALTLLEEVFDSEGSERAQRLLDRVGDKLAARYGGSMRGLGVQERVGEMAQSLEARGVLTDVMQADGTIVLTAYNCPYHELAQQHREICAMDEKMMRTVLGAEVELSTCIMEGHARCNFVVRAQPVTHMTP